MKKEQRNTRRVIVNVIVYIEVTLTPLSAEKE